MCAPPVNALCLLSLLVGCGWTAGPPASEPEASPSTVPGELLVQLADGADVAELAYDHGAVPARWP